MAGAEIGQRQIFLDGHVGRGALQRVLKHASDVLAALVVGQVGDVRPGQGDGAAVRQKGACDGVEQGGFACAVGAHDGDEVTGGQMQGQVLQGAFLVDRSGVEGLA